MMLTRRMRTSRRLAALVLGMGAVGCEADRETSTGGAASTEAGDTATPTTATGDGSDGGASSGATAADTTGSPTGEGPVDVDCAPGTKPGPPEGVVGSTTAGGRSVNVRVPASYDPTRAHPLIVVYSFASGDAASSEDFFDLTAPALERGYIVAYADHGTPSAPDHVADLASVPGLIADNWCVDQQRIFLTGHSDGGTIATFIAASPGTEPKPAAILPSGAGADALVLQNVACPDEPLGVMVIHGTEDSVFPGRGAEAAAWWAACNACADTLGRPDVDGCAAYEGCAAEHQVVLCEGPWTHFAWPGLDITMLDFMTTAG